MTTAAVTGNVFVTQLRDGDELDPNVQRHVLVVTPAKELVDQSHHSQQNTLWLRRKEDAAELDKRMQETRQHFEQRFKQFQQLQEQQLLRQRELQEKVQNYRKFDDENEKKRARALGKYSEEMRLVDQKTAELKQLLMQKDELEARASHLRKLLHKFKIGHDYLLKVADCLPDGYLEGSDSSLGAILMRHQTLREVNRNLVRHVQDITDQVDQCHHDLVDREKTQTQSILTLTSQIANLQQKLEAMKAQNADVEQKLYAREQLFRQQRQDISQISMAIINLSDKCHQQKSQPSSYTHQAGTSSLLKQLNILQEYLLEREAVATMVLSGGSTVTLPPLASSGSLLTGSFASTSEHQLDGGAAARQRRQGRADPSHTTSKRKR